uniref:Uncharacterized protein n=1 Tax=Oryza glumipatula TaxID=40148 RepID=A0A0E0B9C6_9ORYZ
RGGSVTPTTVSGGGAARITQGPRANCATCFGGRGNSEALTTVRIEAWGARSSTSTLGLVLPGFTTNGSTSGPIDRKRPHGRCKCLFPFLFFLFFFSSSSSSRFTESREKGEEREKGALVLRWSRGCDVGGKTCS